jgi:hypothetical protein
MKFSNPMRIKELDIALQARLLPNRARVTLTVEINIPPCVTPGVTPGDVQRRVHEEIAMALSDLPAGKIIGEPHIVSWYTNNGKAPKTVEVK